MTRQELMLAAMLLPAALALPGCQKAAESMPEETATTTGAEAPRYKVVTVAEVKDTAAWEQAFRTHGELFRSTGTYSPILISIGENNRVVVYEEVADLDAYLASLDSEETITAMEADGVKRDTLQTFVLDREFSF